MVDALSSVRWKRHQDAVLELSEHGIVLIVEESGCLQAKVYLKREGISPTDACMYAEIRTRIPDTISWDYYFEHAGNTPVTFTVKPAVLKESIATRPPISKAIFKDERHGDLQIEFPYYANIDLLIVFQCDREVSYRYKYKFLRATTSNFPSNVMKENRGSKVTIGRGGMLKIQHLVSVVKPGVQYFRNVAGGAQQPSRFAYIEFFVKPEEDENSINDV